MHPAPYTNFMNIGLVIFYQFSNPAFGEAKSIRAHKMFMLVSISAPAKNVLEENNERFALIFMYTPVNSSTPCI